mmetsp:Transcript_12306/g.29233  ORF Transcript_12306/g.29233 Transcript_12306/m.29233 type:complete len:336 (+) Transcript_12306:279-1286(+)
MGSSLTSDFFESEVSSSSDSHNESRDDNEFVLGGKNFSLRHCIGNGSFSAVWLAESVDSRDKVAVKVFTTRSVEDRRAAEHEYYIGMKLTSRRSCCKTLWPFPEVLGKRVKNLEYWIYMTHFEGLNLENWLVSNRRSVLLEHEVKIVIFKVLKMVAWLHRQEIVHCDIKPTNLIVENDQDISSLRLIDFGLAQDTSVSGSCRWYRGTPDYSAPELVRCLRWGTHFDNKVDSWAVGVILYRLVSGKLPFSSHRTDMLFRKILVHKLEFQDSAWRHMSKEAVDLTRKLLQKDFSKRISARGALQHSWFSDLSESAAHSKLCVPNLRRFLGWGKNSAP